MSNWRSEHRRRRERLARRALLECLEPRLLLTAEWQNYCHPLDVSNDGHITPLDPLIQINRINSIGQGPLPAPTEDFRPAPYYDASGDDSLTPLDVLIVINGINAFPVGGPPAPTRTFSNGLTGWKARDNGGSATKHGTVEINNCHAVLSEGDSFLVTLERSFEVPQNPGQLEFTYEALRFDDSHAGAIHDAFEVALISDGRSPLVHTIAPGVSHRDAFFNATEGQPVALGPAASSQGESVALDMSDLIPGTTASVQFRLINNDGDINTSVRIVEVELTSGPGNGTGSAAVAGPERRTGSSSGVPFEALVDVTESFEVAYARTSFNDGQQTLFADLSLKNTGAFPIDAPLMVAAHHLSDPSVAASGFDGMSPAGVRFYDISDQLPGGSLNPGEETGPFSFAFANPRRVPFTYDFMVLGKLNGNPQITSVPPTEAVIGRTYAYDAEARDPDDDILAWSLPAAPHGMAIDEATGRVTWSPVQADGGSHAVRVAVVDGRGGRDEQRYTIVAGAPPNRPPRFTSVPVVDADVHVAYTYQPTAVDPDGDTLSFSLQHGPSGMQVEAASGRLTWTPSDGDLGVRQVSLVVSDGMGGEATQDFQVGVQPEPQNRPPVFLTEPILRSSIHGTGNSSFGEVSPDHIELDLQPGESVVETVSLTLADTIPLVDVFLLADDTGSFTPVLPALQEFFPQLVTDLESSLPDVDLGFGVGRFEHFGGRGFGARANAPYILNQPIVTTGVSGFEEALLAALARTSVIGGSEDGSATYIEALFQTATGRGFDGDGDGAFLGSGPAGSLFNQILHGASGDVPPFDSFGMDFSPSLPFRILTPTPLPLDTTVSGQLGPDLNVALFEFDGTKGQTLRFDGLRQGSTFDGPDPVVNLYLRQGDYADTDFQLVSFDKSDPLEVTFNYNSRYVLRLVHGDRAGFPPFSANPRVVDYEFRMVDISSGPPVEPSGFGFYEGSLAPGADRTFTFAGPVGLPVFFDNQGSDSSLHFDFDDPSGGYVFNASGANELGPVVLPASGTYTLTVENTSDAETAAFRFRMIDMQNEATPITLGTTHTAQLGHARAAQVFSLDDVISEPLYLDFIQTGEFQKFFAALYDTNAASTISIGVHSSTAQAEGFLHGSGPGVHYLLVHQGSGTDDPVDFSFRILAAASATPIQLDQAIAGDLDGGETQLFRFEADAGQRILFDDLGSDAAGWWNIPLPPGHTFAGELGRDRGPTNLPPFGGAFYVAIIGTDPAGPSHFEFQVTTPDVVVQPLELGALTSAPLHEQGQINEFHFNARAGKRLFYQEVGPTDTVVLMTPDGNGGHLARGYTLTLQETGDFRLQVYPSASAAFRIHDVDQSSSSLPLGREITGQINANDAAFFILDGKAGQELSLDFLDTSPGGRWRLFNASNELIASASTSTGFEGALPGNGEFVLVIESASAQLDYRFRVDENPTPPVETMGFGELQQGILQAGEKRTFTLTAPAGLPVWIDNQDSSYSFYSLVGPGGEPVSGFRRTDFPFYLPESGTYLLTVENTSSTTETTYRFRPVNLADSAPLPAIVDDQLDDGGMSVKAYRLKAAAGDRFFYDRLSGYWGMLNLNVDFFSPSGQYFGRAATTDGPTTLSESGEYYVIVNGRRSESNPVPYRFRLVGANPRDLPELVPGSVNSIRLDPAAGAQLFHLDAQDGDEFFLDDLDNRDGRLFGVHLDVHGRGGSGGFCTECNFTVGGPALLAIDTTTDPFDYKFEFHKVQRSFATAKLGDSLALPIDGVPKSVEFAFEGVAGQRFLFDWLNTFSPSILNVWGPVFAHTHEVKLFSPDGSEIAHRAPHGTDIGPIVLRQSGTYRLTVDDLNFPGEHELVIAPPSGEFGGVGFRRGALPVILLATDTFSYHTPDGVDPIVGVGGEEVPVSRFFAETDPFQMGVPASLARRGASIQQTVDALNDLGAVVIGLGTSDVATNYPRSPLEALATLTGATNSSDQSFDSGIAGDPIEPGDPFYFLIGNGGDIQPDVGQSLADTIKTAIEAAATATGFNVDVVSSDPSVQLENLTGVVDDLPPGDTAQFNIKFTGGAEQQYFDLLFVHEDTGLLLGSIPVNTLPASYLYASAATDADGDALVYDLVTAPDGATVDAHGRVEWQPTEAGDFEFVLQATDGRGGRAVQEFTVTVGRTQNIAPNITSVAPTDATSDLAYEYHVQASDPNSDVLSHFLAQAPTGMTIDTGTGTVHWTPTGEQLGSHPVSIQVHDGRGGRATQSFVITVDEDPAGTAPVITSSPPSSVIALDPLIYDVAATDADGDPLRYDLPVRADGMTIRPDNGIVSWRPEADQVGVHDVVLRVRDRRGGVDLQAFRIEVLAPNSAPVITSMPPVQASVGRPYQYPVRAQDADEQSLEFQLVQAPSGMTIDSQTGVVNWMPAGGDLGAHPVTIAASDGITAATQAYEIHVVADAPNEPPIINSTPRTVTQLGRRYLYTVDAFDPNGDPLSITLLAAPAGMTLGNGIVSWTPMPDQVGGHSVDIEVDDGLGGVATQNFTVDVVTRAVNRPPHITTTPITHATLGRPYPYNIQATDPDGDPLVFTLAVAPAGMSVNELTGALRWTPRPGQRGHQDVSIVVRDGNGGIVSQDFEITVRSVNLPPAFDTAPPTMAAVGHVYAYAVGAHDPEGDALSIALDQASLDRGMTLDPATGLVEWTPADSQIGSHGVEIRIDDSAAGSAVQRYTVVVTAGPDNRPPTMTSTPPPYAQVGQTYEYQATATDPEGQTLIFSLDAAPAGMSIDDQTGLIQWTPTDAQTGSHPVTVTATDPAGYSAWQSFPLEVFLDNTPPKFTGQVRTRVTLGNTYQTVVKAVDDENDAIMFTLDDDSVARGMTVDDLGRITWTPSAGQFGTHPVIVTATDARGAANAASFDVEVVPDTKPPSVAVSLVENPVRLGDPVLLAVGLTDNVGVDTVEYFVDGTPTTRADSGQLSFDFTAEGQFLIRVVATDPSDNTGEATVTVTIDDPGNGSGSGSEDGPDVALTALELAPGDRRALDDGPVTITNTVGVIGSIGDPDGDLVAYWLEVAPPDGPFHEIARVEADSGKTLDPVTDGFLGRFDPTLLPNDAYTLRLMAEDQAGNQSLIDAPVAIMGGLKLGNFTLSFTDLTIPVSGIPITVARTYDSLNSRTGGELGFGWRLEIHETDLRSSVPETSPEMQDALIFNPYYFGAKVYVTVPGQGRQGFTFQPEPSPGYAGSFLGLFRPRFVPDPAVTSSLTVEPFDLRVQKDGTVADARGFAYNPANPVFGASFTLTQTDGIVYEIDGLTGDTRIITDRNANTLTFTDQGIVSSTGKSVTFERDPQGRIVSVIDPMGNRVAYRYDAAGDLVRSIDREGNVTQYVYDTARPHYLSEVVDPLGRTGVRSEYDEHNRLVNLIDASGQVIELAHDPENSVETVKNQLGHPTVFEYDSLGNVVTQIDPEGSVTRTTYDDPANPTSETSTTVVLADGTELTTQFSHDARGNVLVETDPLGNVTRSTYDRFGNVLTTTDPLGNTTTSSYDRAGNLLSTLDADGVGTAFSYDSSGNPLTLAIGDRNTSFQYDSVGNVEQQVGAGGDTRTHTYDDNGNQLTETVQFTTPGGPSTVVTTNQYDDEGRVTLTVTEQDGVELTRSGTRYDAAGNSIEQIDGLGRVTKFVYDDRGLLTETIFPDDTPADDDDNPRTRTDYDAAGQVIAEINEVGHKTRFQYDTAGRRTKTVFPAITVDDPQDVDPSDNPFTETVYDLAGRVVAEIDERGNRTEFQHDAAGNRTTTILPDATPADAADNPRIVDLFDESHRRIASTDPLGHTTRFVYSDGGLLTETILPDTTSGESDNPRTVNTFDDNRQLVARTDPAGSTTGYEYDSAGRLTTVVQTVSGSNLRTDYEYDELGNLIVQRDAIGRETQFEYDGLGRRTATVLPLLQRSETAYDAVGNAVSTTDFNGDTITFQYDVRDRLTARNFPDGTSVEFTYTASGLRKTVTDSRGVTTYAYDERDRLKSRTDPDGSRIAYTYDVAGNVETRTTTVAGAGASHTTTYTYDALNRQATVSDVDGDLTRYTYDAASRLVRTELPNGTVETRTYDPQNRLLSLEHRDATDAVFASFAYELDKAGNRTAVTEHDGRRVEYAYDELYRLIGEDIFAPGATDPTRSIDYTYDYAGNRLTRDDSADGLTQYTYDANDRLTLETAGADSTRYEYDADGNTLRKVDDATDTVTTEYIWDYENRLVAADTDGDGTDDVAYKYDADGMRVAKSEGSEITRFLLDKNRPYAQVLEEYTPGGVIKVSYVHGLDLISQNRHGKAVKLFYHVDGLGSSRTLTDALGIVADRHIYDAFGRTIGQVGSTGNVYLYAGEQRDSVLDLDYLRARYLDVRAGRFVSRDEFPSRPYSPVTLHRHLYANANPVSNVDPSGENGVGVLIFTAAFSLLAFSFFSSAGNMIGAGAGAINAADADFRHKVRTAIESDRAFEANERIFYRSVCGRADLGIQHKRICAEELKNSK